MTPDGMTPCTQTVWGTQGAPRQSPISRLPCRPRQGQDCHEFWDKNMGLNIIRSPIFKLNSFQGSSCESSESLFQVHMSSTKPIRRRNHRCDFEVGTSLCELFNSFKCRFVEDSSRWLWLCLCEVQTNIKKMEHVDRVVLKVFNQTPKKVTPNDGWWINSCSNWWLII